MANLRDLFESGKGIVEKGFDIAREKSSDAYNSAKNYLRGSQPQPAVSSVEASTNARAAAAEKAYTDKVNAFNERASARPRMSNTKAVVPYNPVEGQRPGPAGAARSTGVTPPDRNTNVGGGRSSAEARAFQAQPKGVFPEAPKPGMLRGAARIAARAAAPLAAAAGVPSQLQHGATDMDDQIAIEMAQGAQKFQSGVRSGFADLAGRVGVDIGPEGPGPTDAEENGPRALRGNLVSLARRTGNALVPDFLVKNAGDRVVGGIRDIAQGNPLGTTVFPPDPESGGAPGALETRSQPGGAAVETRSQPVDPNMVPTNRGLRAPAAVMAGTEIPNEGFGAIQRTTRGNVGPATKVGSAPNTRAELRAAPVSSGRRFNTPAILAGVASRAVDVKATQAREAGKVTEAELGLKAAAQRTAQARLGHEMRTESARDVDREAVAEVTRRVDPALKGKDRDEAISRDAADLTSRIRRSAAASGKEVGDLDVVDRRQLITADRLRRKLEASRSSMDSYVRDFWGNKRFNTDNLYSYIPASVEEGLFGAIVTMKGGNKVRVEKVVRDGETSWIGPNGPIDDDIMELIKNAKAKKGSK